MCMHDCACAQQDQGTKHHSNLHRPPLKPTATTHSADLCKWKSYLCACTSHSLIPMSSEILGETTHAIYQPPLDTLCYCAHTCLRNDKLIKRFALIWLLSRRLFGNNCSHGSIHNNRLAARPTSSRRFLRTLSGTEDSSFSPPSRSETISTRRSTFLINAQRTNCPASPSDQRTLGTHAQRGLLYLVCVYVSVCLSVTTFSATARNNASNKIYQRLQRDMI